MKRLAGLTLSDEKLRPVVESEGRAVIAWQGHGQMELDFDAGTWATAETAGGPAMSSSSRAYVGIDGFMLPMVTDAGAGKRFDKAVARRRTLGRRKGVRRPRPKRRPGADRRYKRSGMRRLPRDEVKPATTYDQAKEHRLTRATRGVAAKAGRMLRPTAGDVRLRRADPVVAVADGAAWVARLADARRPAGATVIPDDCHAGRHVHQARRAVFGESGPDGQAWADRRPGRLLTRPSDELWRALVETRAPLRARTQRQASDDPTRHPSERRATVDDARLRAAGLDIGSGPTGSTCKSLARRTKGTGMRWTAADAGSVVALEALHQGQLWSAYWPTRLAA